ncbi:hypothetical protein [Bacillus sp. WP8]|uniref:hypothetical protein n=1 Tax=Bacillus sp. WP8 TaxID=756828 RepID=UPI0016428AC2|nr:hypothetical protein [Bacillus sp. WP8]
MEIVLEVVVEMDEGEVGLKEVVEGEWLRGFGFVLEKELMGDDGVGRLVEGWEDV